MITKLIKIVTKSYFGFPKKEKIMIFDRNSHSIIDIFNIKKYYILDTRKESFYILFFFWKLFKILKNKKLTLYQSYLIEVIKFIKPKVILNFIDNNFFFFLIKNYLHFNCLLVCFQHSSRLAGEQKLIKNPCIDYFFSINNDSKKVFKNAIPIGSIKNNIFKLHQSKKNIKVITFISQFRRNINHLHNLKSAPKFYFNKYKNLRSKENIFNIFYSTEIKLIPQIIEYCKNKNFNLEIITSSPEGTYDLAEEIKFFEKLINNGFKNYKFLIKKNWKSSYFYLNKKNIIICVDSTLGLEALKQKIKVFFFTREYLYEWYNPIKKYKNLKNKIWTNKIEKNNTFKILDYLYSFDRKKWIFFFNKEIFKRFDIMEYDFRNKNSKKILKNFLT